MSIYFFRHLFLSHCSSPCFNGWSHVVERRDFVCAPFVHINSGRRRTSKRLPLWAISRRRNVCVWSAKYIRGGSVLAPIHPVERVFRWRCHDNAFVPLPRPASPAGLVRPY